MNAFHKIVYYKKNKIIGFKQYDLVKGKATTFALAIIKEMYMSSKVKDI